MNQILLMYLLLGGVALTFGDIFLKKWALEDKYFYYGIAFLFYISGIILFSLTLKEKNLGVANTILQITNIVTLIGVSYFYFHEKINTLQIIGIIFAVVAVILLEIGSSS